MFIIVYSGDLGWNPSMDGQKFIIDDSRYG